MARDLVRARKARTAMDHLLVVAHPRTVSFTQSMADAYAKELRSLGHSVVVRDLYKEGFNPLLSSEELLGPETPKVPLAVRREQDYAADAAAIALFFPIWWAYMPAIVKGYFDRVLSPSFAYELVGYGLKGYDLLPRLSGKKALIFTSSGADMGYLEGSGQWNAMRVLVKNHILALCGIELLEHIHFPSITTDLPEQTVSEHIALVRATARRLWGVEPTSPRTSTE